ncbi:MAG: hypothetical protein K6E94_05885, partial [Elusimicrobiaceae bacterium]|nr:hypothetical protein [Elusimicrobiaceae bacterium]
YIYKVAKYIEKNHSKIRNWVKDKDPKKQIKEINNFLSFPIKKNNGKDYHPYSFLTKYLTVWSRKARKDEKVKKDDESKFPIYDKYVHLVLKVPARNYEKLYNKIKEIQAEIKKEKKKELSFKQIDYAAWLIGKFAKIKNQKDVEKLLKNYQRTIRRIKISLKKEKNSF